MCPLVVFQLLLSLELLFTEGTFKPLLVIVHLHVGHQGVLSHELIPTNLEKMFISVLPLLPADSSVQHT